MTHHNHLSVGIVGAGIIGRLIALRGEAMGWKVTLFDKGDAAGTEACSYRPPAMLAPIAEMDGAEPIIGELGKDSLKLWPDIVRDMGDEVFFQQAGTLIVAHPQDRGEMTRFRNALAVHTAPENMNILRGAELTTLEPQLDRSLTEGLYIPGEGQIDSRNALQALAALLQRRGITCRYGTVAPKLGAKQVVANDETHAFDLVIDARGYGAKDDLPDLRAVRGEIIRVSAPDIHFNRPVRLLHPRYPLYVVPHADGEYVIGATSIESEDDSPMSVRSTLELLSAAFALNAAFGEARIIGMDVGLRPAFPDNLPRIICEPGLLRVNGLYRHGYLIAPKMAELVCAYAANGTADPVYASLFRGV
jgi:glycine oxidase